MKRSLLILATFVVSVVAGCGGTELDQVEDSLAQSESALVTCSTTCPAGNTLTCTGTTCSATDADSVTCNGTTQYCGIRPIPLCSTSNACSTLNGQACTTPGTTRSCCVGSAVAGTCSCTGSRKWSCLSLQDPGTGGRL
jgi:hypothetical protein